MVEKAEKDGIQQLCADAVIVDQEGRVLITQRALTKEKRPGGWCIPGGKYEPNKDQDIIDTLNRETWEELGLTVTRIIQLLPIEWDTPGKNGVWRVLYFVVEVTGEIVLNDESDAFAFVAKERIADYFTDEERDPASKEYRGGEMEVWNTIK